MIRRFRNWYGAVMRVNRSSTIRTRWNRLKTFQPKKISRPLVNLARSKVNTIECGSAGSNPPKRTREMRLARRFRARDYHACDSAQLDRASARKLETKLDVIAREQGSF
jgi:hypothetical protein